MNVRGLPIVIVRDVGLDIKFIIWKPKIGVSHGCNGTYG